MIINNTGSETHKDMMDLDQLDLDEKNGNVLTLEADEKLIAIEGTYMYASCEQRTVVGQCKMTTSKGRTFGIVFYLNNFFFSRFNL